MNKEFKTTIESINKITKDENILTTIIKFKKHYPECGLAIKEYVENEVEFDSELLLYNSSIAKFLSYNFAGNDKVINKIIEVIKTMSDKEKYVFYKDLPSSIKIKALFFGIPHDTVTNKIMTSHFKTFLSFFTADTEYCDSIFNYYINNFPFVLKYMTLYNEHEIKKVNTNLFIKNFKYIFELRVHDNIDDLFELVELILHNCKVETLRENIILYYNNDKKIFDRYVNYISKKIVKKYKNMED